MIEVARCGCGQVYDKDSWTELEYLGPMDTGVHPRMLLECRNCTCHSTITAGLVVTKDGRAIIITSNYFRSLEEVYERQRRELTYLLDGTTVLE